MFFSSHVSLYRSRRIDHLLIDYMNAIQHLPESKFGPILVTLNPPHEPTPDKIAGRWRYDHPVVSKAVSLLSMTM